MKVHILYNPNKQDVLSRLALALTVDTGWSISKTPEPKADINYFMLYLSYSQSPYNKTRVGAWFSHYETNIPKKADWWQIAAKGVDIRTTTAYYDDLLPYGATYNVQPPIDEQFILNRTFRIGMSGFVHPGGRKGEDLAHRLQKELPSNWQLIASGKGWGAIPHKEYNWGELPDFYRSLDVFLCTSTIEGVPMPPLEALGLNIPLVIPYGVGMMDKIGLYETEGVFRYVAGKYDSMLSALEQAYSLIRVRSEYARQYSIARWVYDHKVAFGLEDKPIVVKQDKVIQALSYRKESTMPDVPYPNVKPANLDRKPEKDACVVYVAYGEQARNMAIQAMNSWKANMVEPVLLISDNPLGVEDVFIEHPDTDIGARSVKTRLYEIVPAKYKRILYLDADTEVIGDVSFLFQILTEGYDFAICCNPPKYYSIAEHRRPDNEQETDETINLVGHGDMLLYNGGVFALKRSKQTSLFMMQWHAEWQKFGARDQSALLRALYQVPLKVCYLTQAWNTIVRYVDERLTAGIIHHPQSARRWIGSIDGRLDSKAAWQAVKRFKEGK